MLVSFGPNAVDVSITAMHPTKQLETETGLLWALNKRRKKNPEKHSSITAANIRLQDVVFFSVQSYTKEVQNKLLKVCAAWALGFIV